jgi:oxygen-independent coproporphyrinogen-3 oxidase
MDPAALERILKLVPGHPWKEATMEAMPGTLSLDNVRVWRDLGIDRVSLGVQSFVTSELAKSGRKHDAATVAADCELLRSEGIGNINLDLIAGLPGQTPESWQASLDGIERIAPPHVSVYILEVDEDSRLGLEVLQGGAKFFAKEVPPEDGMADLYETAVKRLAAAGIHRYEISNFAVPGWESHHNLKYWRLEPYVGFGADAHSFDGAVRTSNVETAQEYVVRLREERTPQLDQSPAQDDEHFFVGLRLTQGIEPREDEWKRFAEPIERFVGLGLLERTGPRLRLTSRGVMLSNEVFQEFVNP